jgi:hypothetical protein
LKPEAGAVLECRLHVIEGGAAFEGDPHPLLDCLGPTGVQEEEGQDEGEQWNGMGSG